MSINRRDFLKTGGLVLAGTALAGAWPRSAWSAPGARTREFRLRAELVKTDLGLGRPFTAWSYNGGPPGPEIRVTQGDMVRVVLENGLPEPTTIHWHGLPVPNAMDGVPGITQKPVPPGGSFVYEFPAEPAGTFIYHSHQGLQLDQGLYGALIVEPRRHGRGHDREYTLLLEDWATVDGGGPNATRRRPPSPMGGMMGGGMMGRGGGPPWEPVYDAYAVNGRAWPSVPPLMVKKGDRVKLRLCGAASATIFDLRLAGHALTVTHADGNPVQPVVTDVLRIGMGERYDVEFTADNPGYWLLGAYENGLGESGLKVPILYQGVKRSQPEPPDFPRGLRLATHESLQAAPGLERPGEADVAYRQVLSGGMHSSYWTINGRVYPDSDRLAVRQGQWVRLDYFNRSPMAHPMHLHGHFFRVMNPRLAPERWLTKDTVIVDPMRAVSIIFKADNPGNWFHHCHNLYHMEAGMADLVLYKSHKGEGT